MFEMEMDEWGASSEEMKGKETVWMHHLEIENARLIVIETEMN